MVSEWLCLIECRFPRRPQHEKLHQLTRTELAERSRLRLERSRLRLDMTKCGAARPRPGSSFEEGVAAQCKQWWDQGKKYKFEKRYLEKHLIGVCSDGASTMVGSKSGVLTRLKELYPDILLWHCMCHRIELAVGDAVKSVTAVNHVKVFMDKLYSLYSQSPSLNRELQTVAASLGVELLKIGRVFDIRWSASSYRTVNAI